MGERVWTCFEVLCSQLSAEKLLGTINSLTLDEAVFVDKSCNWSKAKNWAEWWLRPKHLQMLHKDFSTMDPSMWSRSPSTTNAVECLNTESKSKLPVTLQHALFDVYSYNLYRLDKSACAKHLAALKECSISYRDKTESAKRASAAKRQHSSVLCQVYLLIQWQHMGHQIELATLTQLPKEEPHAGRDDLDIATTSLKQR